MFLIRSVKIWLISASTFLKKKTTDCITIEALALRMCRKLSVMKSIHATWLEEMFNFFNSAQGRVHQALKGWEKAGIQSVVTGRDVLPPVH